MTMEQGFRGRPSLAERATKEAAITAERQLFSGLTLFAELISKTSPDEGDRATKLIGVQQRYATDLEFQERVEAYIAVIDDEARRYDRKISSILRPDEPKEHSFIRENLGISDEDYEVYIEAIRGEPQETPQLADA